MFHPPHGAHCSPCFDKGHRDQQAVEYVTRDFNMPPLPMCGWCRDNEACPGCKKVGTAPVAPAPVAAPPAKAKRPISKPKAGPVSPVVPVEVRARNGWKDDGDCRFRYPTAEEMDGRFQRRSRVSTYDTMLGVLNGAPAGFAEFPIPKGIKPRSFQSRFSTFLRTRFGRDSYSLHVDMNNNTLIVASKKAGARGASIVSA